MMVHREPRSGKSPWVAVSRGTPCPVCCGASWCRLSPDGAVVACRRQEPGCFKVVADKNGEYSYLHRLDGDRAAAPPAPPQPAGDGGRAGPEDLARGYDALLWALSLTADHREALRRRGLGDDVIERGLYRTLPAGGKGSPRPRLARVVVERVGEEVALGVPGIVRREADGRGYYTVAGAAGLLVPCRSADGRVAGLQVRADDPGPDRPRYSWLSSARHGGPGPGAVAHVPLGVGPADDVRVIEGPLKADAVRALDGGPVVAVPGVGTWRAALPALRHLGAARVRLAFDADYSSNAHVRRALLAAVGGLRDEGFEAALEVWDGAAGKGLDDLLVGGGRPRLAEPEAILGEAPPLFPGGDPGHLTDAGNGARLVRRLGRDLRHVALARKWRRWDGRRWAADDTGEAQRLALAAADELFRWTVAEMLRLRRPQAEGAEGGEDARHVG